MKFKSGTYKRGGGVVDPLPEDAFKKLKGDNKELMIIKDANHVDLYDNMEKIPFDKIETFFKNNLGE